MLVEQVLGEFVDQAAKDLEAVARSLEANDSLAVASAVHALKGAAAVLSAHTLHRLATDLEQQARRGELDGAEARLAEMEKEVGGCLEFISAIRSGMAGAG